MTFLCMVCKAKESTLWLENCKDYYLGHPILATYLRCAECGLVQQYPIPTNLAELYDDYPVHRQKSGFHEWARRLVFRRAYFDSSVLPPDASLLDFGCGDGWFLAGARGRIATLAGFEFDPLHAAKLTEILGIPVHDNLDDLSKTNPHRFDAITLHYVMEHLPDPVGTLRKIRNILAPDGLVYILLPNIHSWEARLFGKKWHGLDQPRHLSFPDRAVLECLAKTAGFEVISATKKPFPNTFAASLAVLVRGRFTQSAFLGFLPLGFILSRLFPGGSIGYLLRKSTVE